MTTRTLRILVDQDGNADSRLKSLVGTLGSIGKTAATVAVTGLAALAGGAVAAGAGLISLGSDAEEMQGKFNTVFREEGARVTKTLDEFGDAVGRNKFALMGYASSLQDTFVPLGFARDKAADMSVQLTKLAVDLGSFNNVADNEVLADLQTAVVGNTEVMRKYGVVINQAAIEQEAMSLGLIESKDQLDAQSKAAAIMSLILKGTADAQGDAARTAGSWANTMRGLKASLTETAGEMGLKLLPVFTPFLQNLKDLATRWGPIAADWFVGSFVPALQSAIAWVVDAGNSIRSLAGEFIQAFQGGGVEGVIALLGERLSTLWNETVLPVITGWKDDFLSWADRAVDELPAKLAGLIAGIGEWITANGPTIQEKISDWANAVWAWVQPAIDLAAEKLDQLIAAIQRFVSSDEGQARLLEIGEQIGQFIVDAWNATFTNDDTQSQTTNAIATTLLAVATGLVGTLVVVGAQVVAGILASILNSIGTDLHPATFNQLKQILTNIGHDIKFIAKYIGDQVIEGIKDGLNGGFPTLVSLANSIARRMLETAKQALGIHSRSTEFMRLAEFALEGFEAPFENPTRTRGKVSQGLSSVLGQPALSARGAGGAGGGIVALHVDYHPVISTGDKFELENNLAPLIEGVLQRAGVKFNCP